MIDFPPAKLPPLTSAGAQRTKQTQLPENRTQHQASLWNRANSQILIRRSFLRKMQRKVSSELKKPTPRQIPRIAKTFNPLWPLLASRPTPPQSPPSSSHSQSAFPYTSSSAPQCWLPTQIKPFVPPPADSPPPVLP